MCLLPAFCRYDPSMQSAFSQIRQIDYTVIFTRDMAAMRRFYETVM